MGTCHLLYSLVRAQCCHRVLAVPAEPRAGGWVPREPYFDTLPLWRAGAPGHSRMSRDIDAWPVLWGPQGLPRGRGRPDMDRHSGLCAGPVTSNAQGSPSPSLGTQIPERPAACCPRERTRVCVYCVFSSCSPAPHPPPCLHRCLSQTLSRGVLVGAGRWGVGVGFPAVQPSDSGSPAARATTSCSPRSEFGGMGGKRPRGKCVQSVRGPPHSGPCLRGPGRLGHFRTPRNDENQKHLLIFLLFLR